MIIDKQHEHLHFAAQEVCIALGAEDVRGLNERARVALVQLAMCAGCTHVEWWPEWLSRAEAEAQR